MPSPTTPGTLDSRAAPPSGRSLVALERDELLQLDSVLSKEWLQTDGRGGYATSTPVLCPTRRYHGLLVAPASGHPRRYVFISRFEEHLEGGERTFPLSIARYRGLWSPQGHRNLERFELVPFPSALYRVGEATIRREILMVRGRHTVLVRYAVRGVKDDPGTNPELVLHPFLPCRDADALTVENADLDPTVHVLSPPSRGFWVQPYDALPPISFAWSGAGELAEDPTWFTGLEYSEELARGYPGHEDQWSPGALRFPVAGNADVVVAVSVGEPPEDPAELWRTESRARALFATGAAGPGAGVRTTLDTTAADFLYRAADGRPGILAGFPWFGEWGRDTYISLPGLTLARGKLEQCGEVLTAALPFMVDGLLPNIFASTPEESHYGSADASLWYARAVRAYDAGGAGEEEMLERFYPALRSIAESYSNGTALDIVCDEGGLPRMGSPELNATWMDAVTPDGPVTPRQGFPVETSALWYFLLAYLEELAGRRGDTKAEADWRARKSLAGRTFLERFWIEDKSYLADVWNDGQRDESVRPNMVIAAAFEFSPLSRDQRTDVVRRTEVELLTAVGLRTLSPRDPAYIGHYAGSPAERDGAYHQGTVWPWPIGFYCEAWLRAVGTSDRDIRTLRALLDGFAPHLSEAGLLHCSEVFDGDLPHVPGGAIAQAWSTAELLRAYAMLARGKP